jgi:hypothetical protein
MVRGWRWCNVISLSRRTPVEDGVLDETPPKGFQFAAPCGIAVAMDAEEAEVLHCDQEFKVGGERQSGHCDSVEYQPFGQESFPSDRSGELSPEN